MTRDKCYDPGNYIPGTDIITRDYFIGAVVPFVSRNNRKKEGENVKYPVTRTIQ